MTPLAAPGKLGRMDASNVLDERYAALVERISRYPVTDPAARARILDELEAAYRQAQGGARKGASRRNRARGTAYGLSEMRKCRLEVG